MSVQTRTDSNSQRIAAVAKPSKVASEERKVPLTWEEEELQNYEPKRAVAVEAKRKADARAALLLRELPIQWNALCDAMSVRCEGINGKAGRAVLRGAMPDENHLEIRREDDMGFVIQFDPEKRKIMFTGKVLGFDRQYELIVQTINDVDSTAWFSQTTLATDLTDDLAKQMIGYLLRFDQ